MTRRAKLLIATAMTMTILGPVAHAAPAPDQTSTTPAPTRKHPHAAQQAQRQSADPNEQLIVTGTHTPNRKARQSSSPVTVVSAATIRRSGEINLADALTRTYPAIDVNAIGTNESALTSSIRMRGLGPNQVLVLVDGVRRHTIANINSDEGPDFGSTPVDLNMIPSNAIDHIEVLEDGAAALYGSDAIAGVVNIITKKTTVGTHVTEQTGANAYNGDGWQNQLGIDSGAVLGGDGYIHLSGQYTHTDHFVTSTEDHRLLGDAPAGSFPDAYTGPVKLPLNDNNFSSTPEETRENLAIDFGKPVGGAAEFYGLITYGHRHAETYENFREPTTDPTQYPDGFDPIATIEENDYAATLGFRGGDLFGFHWDISSTYGADEDNIGIKSDANTGLLSSSCVLSSIGPTSAFASTVGCGNSPEAFHIASYSAAQWTNDLNLRRAFNVGMAQPMNLAFGAEHRLESYSIAAGDPASYELGGSSAIVGIEPESAGTWYRDIYAAYIDDDLHPLSKLDVDLAGRFEHYTDTGNTENGKLSARYDFTRRIAARATISNGFRAPTLAEQHYSTANTATDSAGGLLPVDSAAAASIGASRLKPERSTNVSGGIVMEPIDNLHLEADVYQINIRDRIVQGGVVSGEPAVIALQEAGFSIPSSIEASNVDASYITNGASTRTQGLDLKGDYLWRTDRYGNFTFTAGLDLNRTVVTHVGNSSQGQPLLNAQNIAAIATTYPRSKLILNLFWTKGRWDVNLRQTRYGETKDELTYFDYATGNCPDGSAKEFSSSCFQSFTNTPRRLTDVEVGYRLTKSIHLAIGGNDVFNVLPREIPQDANYVGGDPYDYSAAQVPISGAYYYGRVDLTF